MDTFAPHARHAISLQIPTGARSPPDADRWHHDPLLGARVAARAGVPGSVVAASDPSTAGAEVTG